MYAQVGITEQDLSSSSGKVPKAQQLLVQRGFLYGATKVSIGALRVNIYSSKDHDNLLLSRSPSFSVNMALWYTASHSSFRSVKQHTVET